MITTSGYGGDIKLICGIDPNGKIIRTAALSQTETKGIATAVFEKQHESQYSGKDKNLNGVIGVSGATISSTAYRKGIQDALTAFEIIQGVSNE
jgi:electron transport complex protein RnfG